MAKRRSGPGSGAAGGRGRGRAARGGSGGFGRGVLGFILGAAVAVGGVALFQYTQHPHAGVPGARAPETASSFEVGPPEPAPQAHISATSKSADRPVATSQTVGPPAAPASAETKAGWRPAPFGASEEVFEAGARAYRAQCAGCHGRPGRDAAGKADGRAVQFWSRADARAAGATHRSASELFAQTAAGNPGQGMPSYRGQLPEAELWDIALLLKSAGEDLPEPVSRLLRQSE